MKTFIEELKFLFKCKTLIQVTQEHIDNGTRENIHTCPIALALNLALNDATKRKCSVRSIGFDIS
jgi:hypothetical protein